MRRPRRSRAKSRIRSRREKISGESFSFQDSGFGEKLVHFLIREAAVAANGGAVKLRATANSFRREVDDRRLGVTNFFGLKARDVVRDDLGDHRHNAIGQVNARRAFAGFGIERRFRWYEVAHVGDMHGKTPKTGANLFERNRVVKIAGVLGVNRDRGQLAEIGAVA